MTLVIVERNDQVHGDAVDQAMAGLAVFGF